jgi:hypothetical protein
MYYVKSRIQFNRVSKVKYVLGGSVFVTDYKIYKTVHN